MLADHRLMEARAPAAAGVQGALSSPLRHSRHGRASAAAAGAAGAAIQLTYAWSCRLGAVITRGLTEDRPPRWGGRGGLARRAARDDMAAARSRPRFAAVLLVPGAGIARPYVGLLVGAGERSPAGICALNSGSRLPMPPDPQRRVRAALMYVRSMSSRAGDPHRSATSAPHGLSKAPLALPARSHARSLVQNRQEEADGLLLLVPSAPQRSPGVPGLRRLRPGHSAVDLRRPHRPGPGRHSALAGGGGDSGSRRVRRLRRRRQCVRGRRR
jgi:hypothetical protein